LKCGKGGFLFAWKIKESWPSKDCKKSVVIKEDNRFLGGKEENEFVGHLSLEN